MAQIKDIKKYVKGGWRSLIGQNVYDGIQWRKFRGGTLIRRNGGWDIYREEMRLGIRIAIEEGNFVKLILQTLPCPPYRSQGIYNVNLQPVTAWIKVVAIAWFSDGTQDYFEIAAPGFVCDSTSQIYLKEVPDGKKCYKIEFHHEEIVFDGLAGNVYRLAEVAATVEGWRLQAVAGVAPSAALGLAKASVTPQNPLYGESVTFTAEETHPDQWRFAYWGNNPSNRQLSYSVFANEENVAAVAMFADASRIVDFEFILSINSSRNIRVEARILQNRTYVFAPVSFYIHYAEGPGASIQTMHYNREIWLDGRVDVFVFEGRTAGEIHHITEVEISLPPPWRLGTVDIQVPEFI